MARYKVAWEHANNEIRPSAVQSLPRMLLPSSVNACIIITVMPTLFSLDGSTAKNLPLSLPHAGSARRMDDLRIR